MVEVNLKLSEREAIWLRGLVQNYQGRRPEDESEEEKQMREGIFNALANVN